jgi:putative heme-binding domain-containing protein
MGAADETWLAERLRDPEELVRATTILCLTDHGNASPETAAVLDRLAAAEASPFVMLHLASALQRLAVPDRQGLATALLGKVGAGADHNLPLLLWYGIEPIIAHDPSWASRVVALSPSSVIRRLATRRVGELLETAPGPIDRLLREVASGDAAAQLDALNGLAEALRGWRKAPRPVAWDDVSAALQKRSQPEIQARVHELAVVFGDGRAIDELRRTALAAGESGEARRAALGQLIEARPDDLLALLSKLVGDRHTAGVVVRGLAAFDRPEVPGLVLRSLGIMNPEDRPAAVATLASRPAFARVLVRALREGTIARGEVSAFHVRQILAFGDDKLAAELREAWGEIRSSDEEKTKLLARYRALLTPERLAAADRSAGRAVFDQVCASCHKLFGEGGTISVDLTGSGRADVGYLLENIVDPSAIVPADYRLSTVTLKDGRVLSGVVAARTERTLTLQTPTERLTLDRGDVGEVAPTDQSLMPSGLLETLDDKRIADLIAYLMSPVQVPRPASGGK